MLLKHRVQDNFLVQCDPEMPKGWIPQGTSSFCLGPYIPVPFGDAGPEGVYHATFLVTCLVSVTKHLARSSVRRVSFGLQF